MVRQQLPKICCAILLGALVMALSNHRGAANVDVEDRKLEAFIEAAAAAEGVMAIWRPKITQASAESAEALRRQANVEIRESIDAVDGISFDEYREIRQAIASSNDMLTRVTDIMRRRHRRAVSSSTVERRFQTSAIRRNRPVSADS
ncbi:MAG: hypothetical protein AAF543_07000 [Pseudomonadota bacterium]